MRKIQVGTTIRLVIRLIRQVRHNRMPLFWAVAAIAITAAWLVPDFGISGAPRSGNAAADRQSCRVESIYDGDTMTVRCAGRKEKVRLYCIDTPEMGQQPWGRRSRDHLRRITPERVEIVAHDRDRYGRLVGEVMADGRSLNLAMVEAGQAAVYDRYCSDGRYPQAERQARQAGLGVWVEPGLQQRPWEWRGSAILILARAPRCRGAWGLCPAADGQYCGATSGQQAARAARRGLGSECARARGERPSWRSSVGNDVQVGMRACARRAAA